MKPFRFVAADSLSHASALLEADPARARLIAGGTDLLGELKEGVANPTTLVSLLSVLEAGDVEATPEGLRLGALTTLAQLENHPEIAMAYPALAQAAASAATPQIRNVGTLGGNLCQRPRCWYYRSPLFDCRKKGGTICFAANGGNKYHAILGAVDCYIVHPSDLAVALISLKAEAAIWGSNGPRTLPLEEFFAGPERDIRAETVLEPGEVLASVFVPRTSPGHRSVYLKAKERQAMDFALASVALAMEISDGVVRDARMVLGGVAPVPLRVPQAEEALRGKPVLEVDSEEVGEAAVRGARPLRDNHFKVALAASLAGRAVRSLIETGGPPLDQGA